jgi:hypothetical protein
MNDEQETTTVGKTQGIIGEKAIFPVSKPHQPSRHGCSLSS